MFNSRIERVRAYYDQVSIYGDKMLNGPGASPVHRAVGPAECWRELWLALLFLFYVSFYENISANTYSNIDYPVEYICFERVS